MYLFNWRPGVISWGVLFYRSFQSQNSPSVHRWGDHLGSQSGPQQGSRFPPLQEDLKNSKGCTPILRSCTKSEIAVVFSTVKLQSSISVWMKSRSLSLRRGQFLYMSDPNQCFQNTSRHGLWGNIRSKFRGFPKPREEDLHLRMEASPHPSSPNSLSWSISDAKSLIASWVGVWLYPMVHGAAAEGCCFDKAGGKDSKI